MTVRVGCAQQPLCPTRMAKTSTCERKLSELLEEEYYLLKIFGCLLEDGLQECRRVCRKWYEASKLLPVKLEKVPVEALPLISSKFPNITSLSVGPFSPCEEDDSGKEHDNAKKYSWEEGIFKYLPCLRKLTHLNLGHITFQWSLKGSLDFYFQLLSHLKSLKIFLYRRAENAAIFSLIRHLTKLTRLEVHLEEMNPLVVDIFFDICDIQHLDVQQHLRNKDGQLLFPSLTSLTHLDFVVTEEALDEYNGEVLQVSINSHSSFISKALGVDDSSLRAITSFSLDSFS